MAWWLWLLFGLLLLILEVQAFGSFYLMFFGVGALLVGLVTAIGLVEADWLAWVLFTGFSIVLLALFRSPILRSLAASTPTQIENLVGEIAIPVDDIAQGQVGKVELRGTVWSAQSDAPLALAKGTRCRVDRVEGLTLWIRPV